MDGSGQALERTPRKETLPSGSQPKRAVKSLLLHCFTIRELWGDQYSRSSLPPQNFQLACSVPHHLVPSGVVFLDLVLDGQWLLSYVANPDQMGVLPPMCSYLLQWWYFIPGRALIMARELPLFGGQSLGTQLRLRISQWPSNPDWVLVTGYSSSEDEVCHVTLVTKPPRVPKGFPVVDTGAGHALHVTYSCPSMAQPPQLLGRGRLLLPMGKELLLLRVGDLMEANSAAAGSGDAGAQQGLAAVSDQPCSANCQSRPGSSHPGDAWSSIGVEQPIVEQVHLYVGLPLKSSGQLLLDLGKVAHILAPRLCGEHGLAYEALLDYDACAAAGASDGNQATLLLGLLVRASRLPANNDQACYIASALLLWDLNTGRHKVAKLGNVNKAGVHTLVNWRPSWWSLPHVALCFMRNDALLQGQPLCCLQDRHCRITLS